MSKRETDYIKFLNNLSEILSKKISPFNTILAIKKLFKSYLKIEKSDFIIWDNDNFRLNEIGDLKVSRNIKRNYQMNMLYANIAMSDGGSFYLNEEEFPCIFNESDFYNIKNSIAEENIIVYPLISNGDLFGIIDLRIGDQNIEEEFFRVINIASKLIAGAIINYILNEQMEISLNFYKAMKDIAKIIESQYELSYIIPLIGEMIDRFMSAHLIYIFIYKEGRYNLVWPNACKDQQVYRLLETLSPGRDYVLSANSRIAALPIEKEEGILGAVVAYSNIEKLSQKDIDYLVQLTRQSGLTIQRANMYAEVLKYATMDALTGLNNRRQFEMRLKQEVSNSKRNNKPLCCMMLDVDYFKKVNDTYGHAAGDCVLKQVSDVIKREIREYDIACRYGGEEFFIILPQTLIKEAVLVAQRLRKIIEESKMDIQSAGVDDIRYINVTVSIGVCEFDSSMTGDMFVQKADKALYEAKTSGRNRVIVASLN